MTFIRKLAAGAIVAAAAVLAGGAHAQQKPITLGFSQVGAESAWRTANTVSVKGAAKDAGNDAQQVAMLMGHYKEDGTPNIQMTMIYTTPGIEDLTAAVESISWT